MESESIKIFKRSDSGSRSCRRLRRAGQIPAVLYGAASETVSVALDARQFIRLAQKSRSSQVFEIDSDETSLSKEKVIVKAVQSDATSDQVIHVDLQKLTEGKEVKVRIPLKITGEAYGVKTEGGVLTAWCREILVWTLPSNIPDIIEIDVTNLKIGQRIRTGDIALPKACKLASNPLETVASVVSSRISRTQEGEGMEAVEGVEAGEGVAAEGAASSPEAADKK